jgi:hypothetical protein
MQILAAIRDIGLVLTPQCIEYVQPSTNGLSRILPVLQSRVCFTELSPNELPGHAEKFGRFGLEFEIDKVRRLGAMPVFYVPQPTSYEPDGSHVGSALVAIATDLRAVAERLSELDRILHGDAPVVNKLEFDVGFFGSPEGRAHFTLDRDETRNFLAAVGHAVHGEGRTKIPPTWASCRQHRVVTSAVGRSDHILVYFAQLDQVVGAVDPLHHSFKFGVAACPFICSFRQAAAGLTLPAAVLMMRIN